MQRRLHHGHASAIALAAILAAPAVQAEEALPDAPATSAAAASASTHVIRPDCAGGACDYRLTPAQLLALADKLVREKKFDEARPFVAALGAAPGMAVPHDFLSGLIAMETGDPATATNHFRSILESHPGQTRVRLELAKALMMQGKFQSADYHLKLAENDEELPEDIARMIGNARSVIRSNRKFRFGFDFGFAPDSNINSATAVETVDVNFGPYRLPIELGEDARRQSGVGATASAYAGVRLPASEDMAIVVDLDADMVKYEQSDFDDYSVQVAAGPELKLGAKTRATLQGVGLYRWYGGEIAARQFGSKLTVQHTLSRSQRVAVQFDGRRSESEINAGYTGWQLGANASYEQVIGKSALLSASVLARRDILDADFYSSKTAGVSAGLGAELPYGINAGLSGSVTHSVYDAPQLLFSDEARKDWRYQARAYAGLRSLRIAGFSPSVEYNFLKVDSNYDLYATDRHRMHFKLARYF
ncbi:MAG: surface lipoprotein assembly modifier [Sphingomonadaceae bacterium]